VPASRELLTHGTRANRWDDGARADRTAGSYGVAELTAAIADALGRGVPHPNAVRLALEKRRQAKAEPPPLAVPLPEHVKRRDVPVRPHGSMTTIS
jgi:hypothetical protein